MRRVIVVTLYIAAVVVVVIDIGGIGGGGGRRRGGGGTAVSTCRFSLHDLPSFRLRLRFHGDAIVTDRATVRNTREHKYGTSTVLSRLQKVQVYSTSTVQVTLLHLYLYIVLR